MDAALRAEDLAPGDRAIAAHDWSDLRVHRVRDAGDPDFALAYARLRAEFGAQGTIEARDVIRDRLGWNPAHPLRIPRAGSSARRAAPAEDPAGAAVGYELLVLRRAGAVAALRDHTAVVRLDAPGRPAAGPVVVHLSHALVEPAQRGTGLAGWLRALPLDAARRVAAAARCAPDTPVVLVAEMDVGGETSAALRSYERAGFQKVDPAAAPYAQPDFRAPDVLASATPRAVPLALVVRRVGREGEPRLPAAELAAVVDALHAVYSVHVPAAALDALREAAARWIARQPTFRLLPPTA